ncbi:hypothetical protein BST83_04455 [Polaribacter filamentus]|uniref:VCBS repeat-containing protein n=1 Tax=Polaribacter filamentus TaxID=53483 RepID=A0A2S7KV34_9FLAO|nr:hypothetical protein [Polaribacter filamentus]PQB06499.1 hypothetical protein BST83_04455 [Polaribacter filamentus]
MNDAVVYEISNFESIVLINDNNILKRVVFPIQGQVIPVKDPLIKDSNGDGFKDIMVVGNHYGVEIETTRYYAGSGLSLLGDGENNFAVTPLEKSVLYQFS